MTGNEARLRQVLQLILDQVDYTKGACQINSMVGACLDTKMIDFAHMVLKETANQGELNHEVMNTPFGVKR